MNVGVDYSLSYFDGNSGTLIDLGDVQDVKISAMKSDIATKPYNGPPRYGFVPDGYKVDFTITRSGGDLEAFAVAAEANFNNGRVQKPGFLNQTVVNPDGTVSRYQYTNFVVFMENHGGISRDKVVTLSLHGMASSKVQIA